MTINGFAYYANRAGHYSSYADLVSHVSGGVIKPTTKFSIRQFICSESYVVIDGDGFHLFLSIPAILRSILGRRTVFFSVRTESFAGASLKSIVKRALSKLIHYAPKMSLVSIHRRSPGLHSYARGIYIDDPQLWDLRFLEFRESCPPELVNVYAGTSHMPILLVAGQLNEKRSLKELVSNADLLAKKFRLVFAGAIRDLSIQRYLSSLSNVYSVNRYVTDDELVFLLKNSDLVYAYYSQEINRPSGIFGRSVQCGTPVLVRAGGYLERSYPELRHCLISVRALPEVHPGLLRNQKEQAFMHAAKSSEFTGVAEIRFALGLPGRIDR